MARRLAEIRARDFCSVWLPEIVACIASCLSANEIAGTLRLVDKATSIQYKDFKTVRLSLPSPTHIFKHRWGRADAFRLYTRKQRLQLLCLTAASGIISNLEIALDNIGFLTIHMVYEPHSLLEAAATAGQLDVCKMLWERGYPWNDSLTKAARAGHRHVCEWLLTRDFCNLRSDALYAAALGGHEDLMHWLLRLFHEGRSKGWMDTWELLESAADGLSLVAFQRLHQQLLAGQQQGGEAQQQQQEDEEEVLSEYQQDRILAAAAGSSTPDWQAKVEWLEGLGYPRTHRACASAAACSPDEEAVSHLQWLLSRGYIPDEDAADAATDCGNLAALRFLMEQAGVRPAQYDVSEIAQGGNLAMLQYLHTNGCPLDREEVAVGAARIGHLPVVAWAVEVLGVTPGNTEGLFDRAVGSGSIEMLSWLRDRGWSWSRGTISYAPGNGCEAAVEWLVEQGCPFRVDGVAYACAASNGDLAMVRCLHRLGCPWGPPGNVLVNCIRNAPVPALQFLVELGCPVDWDAVFKEAHGRWGVPVGYRTLTWLDEERQRRSLGAQQ